MPERRRFHDFTFAASATRTASAESNSQDLGDYQELTVWLKVTAVSGAGTLDWKLQVSDNNTDWDDHTSFTQVSATGIKLGKVTGNLGRFCRIYFTITDFTSVTFSITGIAKT